MKQKKIFDTIQYIISIAISVLFLIGLISKNFQENFQITAGLIIFQLLISIIRIRLINVIFEIPILVLALIGYIPYFGYLFRFFGFVLSVLDMSTFKSTTIHNKVNVIYKNNVKKPQKKKSKPIQGNVKDAEFEEK